MRRNGHKAKETQVENSAILGATHHVFRPYSMDVCLLQSLFMGEFIPLHEIASDQLP